MRRGRCAESAMETCDKHSSSKNGCVAFANVSMHETSFLCIGPSIPGHARLMAWHELDLRPVTPRLDFSSLLSICFFFDMFRVKHCTDISIQEISRRLPPSHSRWRSVSFCKCSTSGRYQSHSCSARTQAAYSAIRKPVFTVFVQPSLCKSLTGALTNNGLLSSSIRIKARFSPSGI